MQVRIELSTENLARCLSAAHADLPAGQDLAHELIALVDTLRDVREAFNLRLPFADLRRSTVEANRPSAAGFIGRFFEAPLQARIDGLLRAVEDMKLLACLARHRRPGSPAPLFDPHSY